MTQRPWRGAGGDADDYAGNRMAPVTRLHVGSAAASEGLSLAVESYGARHGIELLERVGAGMALWLRRGGRLVLARQTGTVAGATDLTTLLDDPIDEVFADVRRLGGPHHVPGSLPDGTAWNVRFVPLPEGAIAAIWTDRRRGASDTTLVPADSSVPRRLMALAGEIAALGDGSGRVRERSASVRRALDREAWRLLGERAAGLPVDPRRGVLSLKLEAVRDRVDTIIPTRVKASWDIPGGLARVAIPAPGVRFIVEELVRNALSAIGERRGRLRVRGGALDLDRSSDWHGSHLPAGLYVFIEVTDDGTGMPSDKVSSLVGDDLSGAFRAVQGLARGWGGGVRVRSSPGRGTIVQVAIPVAEPPVQQKVARRPKGSRCALVVMAANERRQQVAESLGQESLHVQVAHDSASAVQAFKRQAAEGGVALLVVQHDLADGDGFELARRLREMAPVLPVVLLTKRRVEVVEDDLPDLAPGRVVPMKAAVRMTLGAAHALLPRVRARQS